MEMESKTSTYQVMAALLPKFVLKVDNLNNNVLILKLNIFCYNCSALIKFKNENILLYHVFQPFSITVQKRLSGNTSCFLNRKLQDNNTVLALSIRRIRYDFYLAPKHGDC